MKIKRVYIAGPLTPVGLWSVHPAIEYLISIRHMIRAGLDVFFAGFVPFIPALDFQLFLALKTDERITEPMIKRYSKDWLEACEAMLLIAGWKKSEGTLAEIEFAKEKGIPIFESLEELIHAAKEE